MKYTMLFKEELMPGVGVHHYRVSVDLDSGVSESEVHLAIKEKIRACVMASNQGKLNIHAIALWPGDIDEVASALGEKIKELHPKRNEHKNEYIHYSNNLITLNIAKVVMGSNDVETLY